MVRRLLLAFPFVLGMFLPAPARAHGGAAPAGILPFLGDDAGGETTYGLVGLDDGVPRVVLDQALTSELGARLVRWFRPVPGGVVVGGTLTGVWRTGDWGCTWSPVEGPAAGRDVPDVWQDPLDPAHLLVVTASAEAPGTVLRSRDGGASWADVGPSLPGVFLQRLRAAPGGETIWVEGLDGETEAPVLVGTRDGGASWAAPEADLGGWTRARLLAWVDGALILGLEGAGDGRARLARSGDHLATLELLAELDPGVRPLDYAEHAGARFALVDEAPVGRTPVERLLRDDDGPGPEGFVATEDPAGCLDTDVEPGVLWTCGRFRDQVHFFRSPDGRTFEPHLPFGAVRRRCCPAGTAGAQVDPKIWEALRRVGVGPAPGEADEACPGPGDGGVADGGPPDGGESGGDGGDPADGGARDAGAPPDGGDDAGGCAAAPGAGLAAALALLALAARRRR